MTATYHPATPPLAVLEVDVTLPDIEAFNLHVGFSPRMRARWRRQFVLLYAVLASILVGWNWLAFGAARFEPFQHLVAPLLILAALGIVFTPVSYALHRWNLRRTLRVMLGRSPRDDFLGRKRIEATAEGIAVIGTASRGFYGWAAVTGLQETPELLLVMLGDAMAIVVPKRGQADPALDALRVAVRRHTPVT
ncbi:YcxB family protein [Neoroseomonas rubea]|uniref:YcxB family protein n=1 Tax=Neoroseomonas rubea TaxID=2748666 RepID=UPI0018DF5E5A|nr:YcxB family protein [Roseomonas rubea]